jgi:glycosyltransferase involved in cell wall biosynthesis
MGKKGKKDKDKVKDVPRVSICTPTFNRRPFFKGLIDSIDAQTYPKDRIEWIIVDDGTDKIEDLVKDIPFVKYYYTEKMPLGRKRNFMHDQCSFKNDDDIIIYFDDDDYYPRERISHAVEKLTGSSALCAGSSEIYIWFNTLSKMYRFGPYGPNHSTAGTFAFKRELLKQTRYEDDALLAEEKHFLKNYTIPFVQLDPLKTILVISHEQNTFDKRRLISPDNKQCNESALRPQNFIKNSELFRFYIEEK